MCDARDAQAGIQAWDEIFTVWDSRANHRFAWGELINYRTGHHYWVQAESSDGYSGESRNFSFDEGDKIGIRVCEGTTADRTKWHCTRVAMGTA